MFAIGHPSPKPFLRKAQDAFRCVRKCVLQPCLSESSSNAETDSFQGHFPRYQTVEMKEVCTDRQCTVPHPLRFHNLKAQMCFPTTNNHHERKEESPPPLELRLIWGLEIVKQLFPPEDSQVQEATSPLSSSLPDLSEEEEVSMAYNDSYFCKSDFVRGEWISKETMEGNTMLPPGTKGENEAPRNSDAESDSLHGLKEEGLRIFVAI